MSATFRDTLIAAAIDQPAQPQATHRYQGDLHAYDVALAPRQGNRASNSRAVTIVRQVTGADGGLPIGITVTVMAHRVKRLSLADAIGYMGDI